MNKFLKIAAVSLVAISATFNSAKADRWSEDDNFIFSVQKISGVLKSDKRFNNVFSKINEIGFKTVQIMNETGMSKDKGIIISNNLCSSSFSGYNNQDSRIFSNVCLVEMIKMLYPDVINNVNNKAYVLGRK